MQDRLPIAYLLYQVSNFLHPFAIGLYNHVLILGTLALLTELGAAARKFQSVFTRAPLGQYITNQAVVQLLMAVKYNNGFRKLCTTHFHSLNTIQHHSNDTVTTTER